MDLRIDYPFILLLFIPVAIYFYFVWKKHHHTWKKLIYTVFILRVVAVSALVFALTNPYMLLPVEEEQIIYVIDRSASTKQEVNQAVKFINESLKEQKENQKVAVYSFANHLQSEAILTDNLDQVPELNIMSSDDQTNIEEALMLTANIAGTNIPTRIVLLTDGNETKGDGVLQANRLKNSNISVDVVPLSKVLQKDTIVTQFETPEVAYEGDAQQFHVSIESTEEQNASIVLLENNREILKQDVTLLEGTNQYSFEHISQATGLVKYDVQVYVQDDAIVENNRLTSVTTVEAAPRLLIVQTENKPSSIPSVIGNETIPYDVIDSTQLPSQLSTYLQYEAIIFDNVPAHEVGEAKMDVIEQAVKNFGVGFTMVGGENSFGLGGYYDTAIERLLPVSMDVQGKNELPTLGLVLVIDRSGSMMGSKMDLAKEAAVRSIELLRDDDTLGVIAFDDRPWTIVETDKLTDKQSAIDKVLGITDGGGTEIYTSLQSAYAGLDKKKLQRKHIILLTDGYGNNKPDYETLVKDYAAKGITISTVAIGSDSDAALLETIADNGQGRFYDVVDETTIPAILSRETSMVTRTYIVDDPFYPTMYDVEDWRSLFLSGVAEMNAYIATTAKPLSTVIAESAEEDPVLVEWQYGLGKTIAFTSDSSGAWAGDWAYWDNWKAFWQRTITEMLPEYHDVSYAVSTKGQGKFVVTDPSNEAAFLNVVAVDEKGNELSVQSDVRSASQMELNVEGNPGLVFLRIQNKEGEIEIVGVQLPYSDEYKLMPTNQQLLEQITKEAGGLVLENPKQALRPLDFIGFNQQLFANILLMFALILFFIDITLRRFGFPTKRKGKVQAVEIQQEETPVYGNLVKQLKRDR